MTGEIGPDRLDQIWLIVATMLVLSMQAGFLCLESGFVRAKNSINVAVKNTVDFCVAAFQFWMFGYAFAFGASLGGIVGGDGFFYGDSASSADLTFFLFQLVFCGTATTIVSGAVAERMRYASYILVSALTSAAIYPVFAHWAWAGVNRGEARGWLGGNGFVDFAGSTVVHSVGGWVALAAILVVGARRGRFDPVGRPVSGHNLALSGLGVFLLFVGWFGFNGGSTFRASELVAPVLFHTVLGGVAGGLAAQLLSYGLYGQARAEHLLNGILGGLVAITASAHAVAGWSAVLIGIGGGLVTVLGERLLIRWRLDDAVGAVPVHLFAGIWGTLAVALFGDLDRLGTGHDRLAQLGIQAIGIAACGLYAFGLAYIVLAAINRFMPLRVTVADEERGLNISEHDAWSPTLELVREMEAQRASGDLSSRVTVEPHSDVELVALQYNRVLDRVEAAVARQSATMEELKLSQARTEQASRAKSTFLANMSHELRTPLNAVIGFSEVLNSELFGPIGNPRYKDYVTDILGSGRHLLQLVDDLLDLSRVEVGEVKMDERPIEPRSWLDGALQMLQPTARKADVTVTGEVDPGIAALHGDERLLRQVVLNLAGNAIKFTEPGGEVAISIRPAPEGGAVLAVADTGIGIRQEDIPRALEPFIQLHPHLTKTKGGAGLGLALVRAFVKLHGGTVEIASREGEGTVVTVNLPAERVERASKAA
ncbi:ammonium transporter [Desertibaculum subflavum]|uniref:ammonium transporter n=1 Tax=Desertibaculum subflavum TaxID=2268458 RepID=UPI000E669049